MLTQKSPSPHVKFHGVAQSAYPGLDTVKTNKILELLTCNDIGDDIH